MLKANDDKVKVIGLLLLALAPYLFTYLIEEWVSHSMGSQVVAQSVFNLRTVYQGLITAGPRELRPNYTVLVDINPKTDTIYTNLARDPGNPCGEKGTRNALARILKEINNQHPAVIVIDKFFSVACEDKDPIDTGTKNLKTALETISKETPIVIGRLGPYYTGNSDSGEHGQTTRILEASQPALTFLQSADNSGPRIIEGILNLDLDNRKMALKWSVQHDNTDNSKNNFDTLSFAAVKAYYETQSAQLTTQNSEIEKLLKRNKNPYISFIGREKIDSIIIPAGKLISNDTESAEAKTIPSGILTTSENLYRLRGKIVIIGELDNYYDKHDSVFYRKIPGVILQANYIEAMLDQRCHEPTPWLDYIIGFIVFVVIYYCGLYSETWSELLTCLVGIFIGVFLLIYFLVALSGFYINPITISLLGILIIITHRFFPSHNRKKIGKNHN